MLSVQILMIKLWGFSVPDLLREILDKENTWKDSFIFLMYVIVWSSIFTIEYEWGQILTYYWNHGTWMPDSKIAPGR